VVDHRALVAPSLDIPEEEVLFVLSNSFDVAGAKQFGFKVAWIERGGGPAAPTNSEVAPPEFYKLLRGRAEKHSGCRSAHNSTLTTVSPLQNDRFGVINGLRAISDTGSVHPQEADISRRGLQVSSVPKAGPRSAKKAI
jgi:hypothetical protein